MKLVLLILTLSIAPLVLTDGVCDLALLEMELREDIMDNGSLDCLRTIEPPRSSKETPEEKNRRLAAQVSPLFNSSGIQTAPSRPAMTGSPSSEKTTPLTT
jgi:hypothetical protein